jgi:hypothetical protein
MALMKLRFDNVFLSKNETSFLFNDVVKSVI